MPPNIRVYELARELGLSNKETLDLCAQLGIGVKSHSSSVVEAQADRVRRKADQLGMRRAASPEEPAKKGRAKTADGADTAAATETTTPTEAPQEVAAPTAAASSAPAPSAPRAPSEAPAEAASGARQTPAPTRVDSDASPAAAQGDGPARTDHAAAGANSRPGSTAPAARSGSAGAPPAPGHGVPRPSTPPPPPRPQAPGAPSDRDRGRGDRADRGDRAPFGARPDGRPGGDRRAPVRSTGERPHRPDGESHAPERRPAAAAGAGPGAGERERERDRDRDRDRGPRPDGQQRQRSPMPPGGKAIPPPPGGGRPLSPTGKPIPPPPGGGRPLSQSGKPIPPPPGMGGRGPAPARTGPGGGGGGRPGGPGGGGAGGRGRPGVGVGRPGGPGGGRPGGPGGPGGGPGGAGGGPGGGGPGGFPSRGGPPGRRQPRRPTKGRRRRPREELQPIDVPTYTPREAPVPAGVVVIERASTPQDLGPKLNRTAADVVRFLMQQGEMVTATQSLSDDMIELFAAEIGAEIRLVDPGEEQEVELQKQLGLDELLEADDEGAESRPPVITVMGHVDHGKTKLLDQIRNTNVVAGEAGGITQHIGAYQVNKDGRPLTFIDTPGHEAFTAMRARGAQATDIVVLVVAADDGVMPQTIEALNHAKNAEVPIVVAINKIDRENADPNRVMQQLSEHGLIPVSWGGDTEMIEVSALQNLGIDDLLETLLVVAELEELTANPDGRASGVVLEANLDIGRGPVATVLVQRGTLRVGDPLVAGPAFGRVRALLDDNGKPVKEAGPSTPVQVLGLSEVAGAGDQFVVAPDDKIGRQVAETREHSQRLAGLGRDAKVSAHGAKLEDIFSQIQAGETATLNLIVKADVTGSLEALTDSLRRLERDEVKLSFVHRAVGGITQYDVQLAAASNATIIGFNVRPDRPSRELAMQEDVEIRTYEIIYQVIEDIENAMVGMLEPEFEEVVTGEAEVREIFSVPRVGRVAGCYVLNGTITRGSRVRFLREGGIIWKGTISSLKRFKEDAREVAAGYECGIGLSDFQDLRQGDIIETFEEREIPRT